MVDGEVNRIIVISDTHFGSELFNHDDFCDFLEWIPTLTNNPKTIHCKKIMDENGNERDAVVTVTLEAPEKLILLGDILELWDPICQNRDFTLTHSANPFRLMENLPCKKVYVIGNHDEDLSDIHNVIKMGNAYEKCKGTEMKENIESIFHDKLKLEIYDRHYPPKDKKTDIAKGEQIGKWTYFFLHGHQFDKIQVTKAISDFFKTRIDPIDYLQDLVNISFTKDLYGGNPRAIAGFIISFVVWLGLGYKLSSYDSSNDSLLIFILLFIPFLLLTLFVLVTILPKPLTYLQRKVWELLKFKVKDKSAKEVVEESFMARQDKINADVVVFGHTHFAGKHFLQSGWKLKGLRKIKKLLGRVKPEEEGRKKLFVNTGGWVVVDDKDELRKVNTFAYIDKTGIYLFKWEGKDKDPSCIEGFSI